MVFAGDSAVSVDLPSGVNLDTSTLATRFCGSVIGVILPIVEITLFHRQSNLWKWRPVGDVTTTLSIDVYNARKGWQEKATQQQEFIRAQDSRTRRIWYMYKDRDDVSQGTCSNGLHVNGVYLPPPRVVSPGAYCT